MLSSLRWSALAFLAALFAVLAFTSVRGVDARTAARYRIWLRQLRQFDNGIETELLRTRSGAVNHYDGLVQRTKMRKQVAARLAATPKYLDDHGRAELLRALEGEPGTDGVKLGGLAEALERQDDLVEDFKFHHAVLRHAVRYLPFAARELVADAPTDHPEAGALTAELNALFTDVLLYHDFGEPHRREAIQAQVERLRDREAGFLPPQQQTAIKLLARHAEIILDKKVKVDSALEQIGQVPVSNRVEQLRRVFERNHEAAATRTIGLRYAAFVLALGTILLGAAYIILRIKHTADALQRTTNQLEVTNQALETEKDKQKELAELKSRFVSMTSHEFRTPLSVILSSSELLEAYGERWGADKRNKHLGRVQSAAKQMKQMLEAVLIIGRSEAGMLEFSPRRIDVVALCNRLVDELHMNVSTTHAIELRIDDEVGDAALDERLMGHLLGNLLSNAMKYSPEATRVKLVVARSGDDLVFAVSDEGIGIEPDDLDGLFETFRRGGNVGNISGTGLGLAIVQKAVELHGGVIDVDSEVGVGTTFTARLPLEAPGDEDAERAA
jgi:signal transduction histidine kinase